MDRPQVSISVTQGSVHVNDVRLLRLTPELVYLEADLRTKYAEVSVVGHSDTETKIWLHAGEHSLHTEDTPEPSLILITGVGGEHWHMPLVDVGRYTLRAAIVARGFDEEGTFVWRDDD